MFEVLGGGGGCMAGLSHSPTPGKGSGRDGPGALLVLFCSRCVFRAFQESPGEPSSHLQAATCSVGPQGYRRCVRLKGREGKKGEAVGCLDVDPKRRKGTECVGAWEEAEGWGLVPA